MKRGLAFNWFSKGGVSLLLIISLFAVAVSHTPVKAEDGGTEEPLNASAVAIATSELTDQLIIKYKASMDAAMAGVPSSDDQGVRLSDATGMEIKYVREMSGDAHVLRLPGKIGPAEMQAVIEKLLALPEVEYVEPDYIRRHTLTPNDPLFANQWHYAAPTTNNYGINAQAAWNITTGSDSIVVAVVDTGILNHADLSGRTVPGYDFIADALVANDGDGRDSDPSDPGDWITSAEDASGYFAGCGVSDSSWHGTHVSGTIGAATNNSLGVAGINWNSKILPVRVLGKCGGYDSDIIDGMRWAAGLTVSGVPANANPAKVINISLGGTGSCSTSMQSAINAVTSAGTTVVVAAGNDNVNASNFSPGNCNNVITVAATNRNGNKASYSNYGSVVEISAPGGDTNGGVLSTLNTGTKQPVADSYAYYMGTSMATPHVAGVVSLLYSIYPSITPSQVLQYLQNNVTAFPGGSTCNTSICGSGILNAGAAVSDLYSDTVQFTLDVSKLGGGTGTVTSSPAGINCGSTCSANFPALSSVTLTAVASSGSAFTGWSGAGCTGTGTCTVTMTAANSVTATFTHQWQTWYLAEGYTGAGFGTFILLQNPNDSPANVTLTYMLQGGGTITRSLVVDAKSRYTVAAQDAGQVGVDQAFSTKVTADLPIIVERAMYWPDAQGGISGHNTTGFNFPATTWYLAEGYTGDGFGTYILIQNPNDATATVDLTYMLQGGGTIARSVSVGPNSRYTVVAQDTGQVGLNQAFSTKLTSNQPIIVERAMYFADEGHAAGGVTTPGSTWYLAEGYTGAGFGTYILIQNPNASSADVTLTYMLQGGGTIVKNISVAANSRYTVVAQDPAQVGVDQAFSTKITSNRNIIVERAMYWPKGSYMGGHDSTGVTSAANVWYLAEGYTGAGFETFILIQNPNSTSTDVTVTYMLQTGENQIRTVTIPGNSRYTIAVQDPAQLGLDQAFATKLVATQPVIVERAMYFSGSGHGTMGVQQP